MFLCLCSIQTGFSNVIIRFLEVKIRIALHYGLLRIFQCTVFAAISLKLSLYDEGKSI